MENKKTLATIAVLLATVAGITDLTIVTPKEAIDEVQKADPKICAPEVTPEYVRICTGVYDPNVQDNSDVVITAKKLKRAGVEAVTTELNKQLLGGPCDPGVACQQMRLTFDENTGLFIPEEGGVVQEIIFPK